MDIENPDASVSLSISSTSSDLENPEQTMDMIVDFQASSDYESLEQENTDPHDKVPESLPKKFMYYISFPYRILFRYSIPSPSSPKFKYMHIVSFILCLFWLALITFFMIQMASKIGCILNISESVMGVTFLAIGTSLPDCLTSIFVAKSGKGSMAVSNALGSNVFDIFFALCLPWVLSIAGGKQVEVSTTDFEIYTGIVLTCILILFMSFRFTNWKLTKRMGYILLALYLVFLAYTVLHQVDGIPF
eukprot:TRINITY_DN6885_c0_g1_i2.p1 TRINITY_DN6885_c0_g1~~TRINITY_DN6885_c0_g1_i2.p1  ORF type:complete len:247 (+),score=29.59 TRINITY_DN6885_c0_g1_i2:85-825(+)